MQACLHVCICSSMRVFAYELLCCVRLPCFLTGCCVVSSGDQRVAECKQHEASWGLMGICGFEL